MNGLRAAWAVMKNDFVINLARPSSALLAILIPLNFLILFALFALSGGHVPVTVQQADRGHYGAAMAQALHSTNTFAAAMVGSVSAGDQAINRQTSVASIRIPADFSRKVSMGAYVAIPVTINNLNDDFAADIRRALPLGILNFYNQALPKSLPLTWKEVDTYPKNVSFLGYIAVSIQTVALLLGGILLTGRAVAGEWERGTIKELKLAPVPAWGIVLGKLATGYVNGLMSALLVFGALFILGIYPHNWVQFIGVLLLTLFVFVSIGLAIGSLIRSQFVIYPLTMGISLPLFFISGAFGPISWGAEAGAWIARMFPIVYVNAAFQDAIHGYWPIDVSAATLWVILAIWALGSLLLSIWLFRRTTAAH